MNRYQLLLFIRSQKESSLLKITVLNHLNLLRLSYWFSPLTLRWLIPRNRTSRCLPLPLDSLRPLKRKHSNFRHLFLRLRRLVHPVSPPLKLLYKVKECLLGADQLGDLRPGVYVLVKAEQVGDCFFAFLGFLVVCEGGKDWGELDMRLFERFSGCHREGLLAFEVEALFLSEVCLHAEVWEKHVLVELLNWVVALVEKFKTVVGGFTGLFAVYHLFSESVFEVVAAVRVFRGEWIWWRGLFLFHLQ